MSLKYAYTRKRADFGRQCNFSDRAAELHTEIAPDPELAKNFILRNPVSRGIQHANEMSEHEVNTERVLSEVRGVNHTEGGWPKDVNYNEPEQVQRYRKKIEKDEQYAVILQSLANSVEHCIKQNNALNIYEDYFNDVEYDASEDPPSAKVVKVFRDINDVKRTATYVSWFPESPTKIAVAYSITEFLSNPPVASLDSYIWDFSNPNQPDLVLAPPSSMICIEFNPKDTHTLVGGCYSGQLCLWDRRKGSMPVEISPVETSHRDPAWQVIWIQSKTGTEFFSTSTDGQVLWWDVRRMSEPTEVLYLDPTKNQDLSCSIGAYALEFESTIPTKFMVGTEQGIIISCNRKGKTAGEKVAAVYPGHKGPVYALQRNPFFPKFFLSVGDWSARIWAEDLRDDPIMWTPYHESGATDGRWSPVRPALFFMTRLNGCLELWDCVFKQKEPTLNIKVSDDSLHCVRVDEEGSLVAVGSRSGVTTILELSSGFVTPSKSEKSAVGAMFERETHRERILEARAKELRVKARQRATAEATAIEAGIGGSQNHKITEASEGADNLQEEVREKGGEEGEESASQQQESPEELLKRVEREFFEQIDEERREREREINRRSESLNDAADEVEEEKELEESGDGEDANETSVKDTGEKADEPEEAENLDDA
ncbi:hypothetical protein Aperf_G00000018921 [Anoplocephala perfoliata]